jgi:hypothetical protein
MYTFQSSVCDSSDLAGFDPATLNGMILYYCLMTKWSGLGDSTELSRMGLSQGSTPHPVPVHPCAQAHLHPALLLPEDRYRTPNIVVFRPAELDEAQPPLLAPIESVLEDLVTPQSLMGCCPLHRRRGLDAARVRPEGVRLGPPLSGPAVVGIRLGALART